MKLGAGKGKCREIVSVVNTIVVRINGSYVTVVKIPRRYMVENVVDYQVVGAFVRFDSVTLRLQIQRSVEIIIPNYAVGGIFKAYMCPVRNDATHILHPTVVGIGNLYSEYRASGGISVRRRIPLRFPDSLRVALGSLPGHLACRIQIPRRYPLCRFAGQGQSFVQGLIPQHSLV